MDIDEKDLIQEESTPKKFGFFSKFFFFLLAFLVLLYCYMHFVEPKKLIVKEYPVKHNLIPESFNGFKIVQFSDIYFGSSINENELKRIVHKINELKPDVLVFTGNLFSSSITLSEANKSFLKDILKETQAKIKKFAIKGNSDYLDIDLYEEILENANFTILDNLNIPIYFDSDTPIYFGGISSISKKEMDLTKALIQEDEKKAYQIFLLHEPILFDEICRDTHLILSGHSLGGILRLPFLGGTIALENVGEYTGDQYFKGKSVMYVSSGLGTEKYNVRFFNPPSISLYRLYHD